MARIITQRLKPFLADVINPCQAGFVPGRCTSDNVILVQEIIRDIKQKRENMVLWILNLILKKLVISWNRVLFKTRSNFSSFLPPF